MDKLPSKLAFVDIETTGTSFLRDRIIEIGIVRVEDDRVAKEFQTLVNPETWVSPFIAQMTGIKQEELEGAPTWETIKGEVEETLQGCVFVAHNVRFDYGFVRREFDRAGKSFSARQLCTVKLFRDLYPQLKRHNLDHLIEYFNIECKRRHRAYDDALVLWEFYKQVRDKFPFQKILQALGSGLRRPNLPYGVSSKLIDALPEGPGVYIFYGDTDIPLYVGKSIDVKARVLDHFSADTRVSREGKISGQVKRIEALETGGELGALLLESQLIKKLQPIYNRKLRLKRQLVTLVSKEEKGYKTVEIQIKGKIEGQNLEGIVGVFRSEKQAKEEVVRVVKEHRLCPKLCGLEKGRGACFYTHLGVCKGACQGKEEAWRYNVRFVEAFGGRKFKQWPFKGPILITEGREGFVVDRWCVVGRVKGEFDGDIESRREEGEYEFDLDTYKILASFILNERYRERIKVISGDLPI